MLVGLVGLSPALVGCGSASTSTSGGSGVSCPTQVPGVTSNSIKVGLIYPDTGQQAVANSFQAVRSAVAARIDLQNSKGGINGRTIQMVWRDDQSDQTAFDVAARDLVNNENVFGLVSVSIVATGTDATTFLRSNDVPVVGAATNATWNDLPNYFHYGNIFTKGVVTVYGDYVRSQGGTRAVILVDPTTQASGDLATEFADSLQSAGVTVVGSVQYTQGVSNPEAVANLMRATHADTIVGSSQIPAFVDIFRATKQLGVHLSVALNIDGYNPSLLAKYGSQLAGMSVVRGYVANNQPPMQTYFKTMTTYAPEVRDPTDALATAGYVAADEMLEGLQRAGACPTRQSFIKDLRADTAYTAGGMIAPVDLSKPSAPDDCWNFMKVNSAGTDFSTINPPAGQAFWCGTSH
jgi:ABC-type branched-subunit amino acid transport system substrate-binding protein